ncbi:MAG: hypothetical protein NW206_18145 [Hyphomonadaceae bacterium]|nr:hypothetical protein [Hyphomonadaceae bacterium]
MSSQNGPPELQCIANDLTEACALLSANLVRVASGEAAPSPEINVEARLYAAAVVVWSIRNPDADVGANADALLDVWLANYLADLHSDDAAALLRALDHRTPQYVVLWEAGGDWALNTARFLDVKMRTKASPATLSALAAAAAAGREGIAKFIQAAFAV